MKGRRREADGKGRDKDEERGDEGDEEDGG